MHVPTLNSQTKIIFIILFATQLLYSHFASAKTCTYATYQWNSLEKKVVNFRTVEKSYKDLTQDEKDPTTGCSVCSEDQVELKFKNLEPFKACKALSSKIKKTFSKLIENGSPIYSIVGYRVGQTRGPLDEKGNRTLFSNHSFGVALDINSEFNGLYTNCETFGPECKLVKGGSWSPPSKGTLTQNDPIVIEFKKIGLKWGGESKGVLKDFMHFSPTGY